MNKKHIIGIDEAGRGPVAGPVSIGAVIVQDVFLEDFLVCFSGVKDSKKLSPKKRELWFLQMKEAKKKGLIDFSVSLIKSGVIDNIGIAPAIRMGIQKTLSRLGHKKADTKILLDGGLKAPDCYKKQETIIRGDEKEIIIALASIVAKVSRDAHMIKIAEKFPKYIFEQHKGYGTAEHYKRIKQYGLCEIHRKSFLKKLKLDI